MADVGIRQAAGTYAPPWSEARLEAMEGRMLAESIRLNGYVLPWSEARLEAMEGRMLAESIRLNGSRSDP